MSIKYSVHISEEAHQDIKSTYLYIVYDLSAFETANNYINNIFKAINQLSDHSSCIAISKIKSLREQYGDTVRTVRYKK